MPTPRRYADQAQRQAAYRQRVAKARRREMEARGLPPLPAVPCIPGRRRWQALTRQAILLLQIAQGEMQDYYDQRSDTWQDSDRGEAFLECLQATQDTQAAAEELLG